MKLKIAIIQMDIRFGDTQANYENVTEKIREAAKNAVDFIVLPELWTTGYDLENLDMTADLNGEKVISVISALAKTYHVNILAGSIAKKDVDGNITNTSYVFGRDGGVIGEYSKVHLFRLMEEEKYLTQGNTEGLFQLDETIPCAVNICYDIRFPEWFRNHILKGAKLFVIPAEWPLPRKDHWKALLIARAIENQCYLIACNRSGSDPNNVFAGHSIIINPWGELIAEADEKEQILYGDIDLETLDEFRNRIPVFEDRRTDLY
jgi:omega-amidase